MAVAIDLGDPGSPFGDIHPRYKQQVGARLARAALDVAFGVETYWTGPIFGSATLTTGPHGGKQAAVKVLFTEIGPQGIEVRYPTGDFELYDSVSGAWLPAKVIANGPESVTLIPLVKVGTKFTLTQIRYDWAQAPCRVETGIYNCAVYSIEHNLPAPPFMADISP